MEVDIHMEKGDEIPLLSRIISIADAYDAMTTDRPYRKAMSKSEALDEIKEMQEVNLIQD